MKNKPVRFLEGEKVYLRPLNIEDTELYYQMLYHPKTRMLTGTKKTFTRDQIEQYIANKPSDTSSVLLLISSRENDEVVGDIAIQDIDVTNRNANIRLAISDHKYQGKGFGQEALELMLDYGFGVLNLHRIELQVYAYNDRAAYVYEKLGFKKEGVMRDHLFYNHQYHDTIIMSILEEEFRARPSRSKKN